MTDLGVTELGERRFTMAGQLTFAQASGDRNPIHVDELAARRLVAGSTVVHGVHLALWAIDRWATVARASVARVRASFLRPVRVGDTATVRHVLEADGTEQLLVVVGDEVKAVFVLETGTAPTLATWPSTPVESPVATPRPLTFDGARLARGSVEAVPPGPVLALDLPSLPSVISASSASGLLAVSRVVGMECPGLHSLLVGFDLVLGEPGRNRLIWRVTRATSPRSPVTIDVDGPVRGTVSALFRPAPVAQPSFASAGAEVVPGEFSGQRALVVGGSRGLGELTAKVLAAGGADVVVTYRTGRVDATRVAEEITSGGGRCSVLELDVKRPPPLTELALTHLYYYASPHIGTTRSFDRAALAMLLDVYVDGFWTTCRAALTPREVLRILYPSSVFVSDPPIGQAAYVTAKGAGEALAEWMDRHLDGAQVVIERFPRLLTDQTASIGGPQPSDGLPILLPVLRSMHGPEETDQ